MPVKSGMCFFWAVRETVLKAGGFNMCPAPPQAAVAISDTGCAGAFFSRTLPPGDHLVELED
jgi:hypothetical protein